MDTGILAVLMWAALTIAGLLGHLVGDYLVQTHWMAMNKAKPIWIWNEQKGDLLIDGDALEAITLHALTWAMSVGLFIIPAAWVAWGAEGAVTALWATVALGVIHWIQDRRWPIVAFMKATGKDPGTLWLLIVVDNVWHLLQIAGAAAFIVWRIV